jgi:hypothetical protein
VRDEGNVLTEEIAQAYGIETVFTGETLPQMVATAKLVRSAKVLLCRLDRRVPYASGDLCTEASLKASLRENDPQY